MASPYLAEMAELKSRLADGVPEAEQAALELRLAVLLGRTGETDQSLVHMTTVRRMLDGKGDRRGVGQVDALIGAICAVKGEHDRAATYFERARETAASLGDADLNARVITHMADAAAGRGDAEAARRLWEEARRHFEKYWDGSELSRIYGGIAVQLAASGELDDADRLSEKAVEDAESSGDPLWIGRALLARGRVRAAAKDVRAARRFFRRGISVLQDHELRRDLAEAYLAFGTFVGESVSSSDGALPDGFTDPPAFWLAKAQGLFRELGGLADLERVRESFRRHGRRATDKIAEVEMLQLLQELKQNRIEVQRQTQRLADFALQSFESIRSHAPRELAQEIEVARLEVTRTERAMARGVDQMALAEERFLGALNAVILERENTRTLLELCRSLNEIRDYARLPSDIAKMAAQLTGADRALVALIEPDGKLAVRGSVRIQDEDAGMWRGVLEQAVGKGGAPRLITSRPSDGDPARAPARDVSSRAIEQAQRNEQMRLGFAMACPLRHGEKIFGAIYADKELCGGVFAERDLDILAIFAAQVATILENGRVAEELRLAARTRAATLEAISDGVLSLAASGAVTSINATAMRILGVAGNDPQQLRLASFPDLAFLGGMLARGEEIDGRVTRLSSGDYLLNARCVRADGGAVVGLVVTLTEMKRATSLAQKIVGSTARFTFGDIIGAAPLLRRRLQLAEAAARTDSSVLVTGESGTGKELVGQAIHNAGLRAGGPFVGINCAAIPRELLESELFGYEAGAFTGAKRGGHPGKFELAEGGTILLDEIGDMPLEMQAKLLRVLQERRVQRLGGIKDIPLDTRVIATTNRDLAEECERGRFRQDLFFRLRVIHVELPPLRARLEDIPLLVEHFLQLFSARLGKSVRGVTPHIMDVLLEYPWPGNIRELEHVLEGEVNLAPVGQELLTETPVMIEGSGSTSRRRLIPEYAAEYSGNATPPGGSRAAMAPAAGGTTIAESEKQLLLAALAAHRGSVPDVARALGVSRGTVYNKMKKFQIDPDSYRNE